MKSKIFRVGGFLAIVVLGMFIFRFLTFSTDVETENDHYKRYVNQHYKVFAIDLPDSLTFAGEKVELEMDDIKERLDREMLVNAYWQSQTLLFIKRANKFFPVIEPILKENGVPDDFKYLALTESGLMNVVSPAGATGYWQILKTTGKELGLEINSEVDERYHLEKSTEAFCKYMNQARNKFGNWTLAAASYNMGMAGLNRQITKQKVNNYYDLLLNEETGRYVFRILAVKEIMNRPTNYGFYFRPQDLYKEEKVRTIEVSEPIEDFADFAIENGINYKILKVFNPWLRQGYLKNVSRKTYELRIPLEGYYTASQTDSTLQ